MNDTQVTHTVTVIPSDDHGFSIRLKQEKEKNYKKTQIFSHAYPHVSHIKKNG